LKKEVPETSGKRTQIKSIKDLPSESYLEKVGHPRLQWQERRSADAHFLEDKAKKLQLEDTRACK
jgi:hypothetical protein